MNSTKKAEGFHERKPAPWWWPSGGEDRREAEGTIVDLLTDALNTSDETFEQAAERDRAKKGKAA